MDNNEDHYDLELHSGLEGRAEISAFSHPAFLRQQLLEQNASIGAIPEGCSLVGFDLRGYSAYRDGLSSEALLALAEDVDVFTQELASHFGLLLTGRPAGDSATFIALPSFDEAAYRAFIEGRNIHGLSMRSAVQPVQKGTAFVHLFEGGALGLSGSAVVAYNAELNGMKHEGPLVAVEGNYPILDVDPAHVKARSLAGSSVDAAFTSFGHAILKIHPPTLGDPEAVQKYIRGLLEGSFRGARVLDLQEGIVFLQLARKHEVSECPFVYIPNDGVTLGWSSDGLPVIIQVAPWVCHGIREELKGKAPSVVNTGFRMAA